MPWDASTLPVQRLSQIPCHKPSFKPLTQIDRPSTTFGGLSESAITPHHISQLAPLPGTSRLYHIQQSSPTAAYVCRNFDLVKGDYCQFDLLAARAYMGSLPWGFRRFAE